jgi:hypothetical protein
MITRFPSKGVLPPAMKQKLDYAGEFGNKRRKDTNQTRNLSAPCSGENVVDTCGPSTRCDIAHLSQPLALLTVRQAGCLGIVCKLLQQLLLKFDVCGGGCWVGSAASGETTCEQHGQTRRSHADPHLLCLKLMAMLRTLTINSESCEPAQSVSGRKM